MTDILWEQGRAWHLRPAPDETFWTSIALTRIASLDVLATDPMEGVSAVEFGAALGDLDTAAVCLEEKAGRLFSLVRGTDGQRTYPAVQAWPGIAGPPLWRVLSQFGEVTPTDAYGFFGGDD